MFSIVQLVIKVEQCIADFRMSERHGVNELSLHFTCSNKLDDFARVNQVSEFIDKTCNVQFNYRLFQNIRFFLLIHSSNLTNFK